MASISPAIAAIAKTRSCASARCSPPLALPAVLSIGCSPAAKRAPGSDSLYNVVGSAPMNRTGLVIALIDRRRGGRRLRRLAAARPCRVHAVLRPEDPRFSAQRPCVVAVRPHCGTRADHAPDRAGRHRAPRQVSVSAPAHADQSRGRAVPDRDARGRPRPPHQYAVEGSLGPGAADRRHRVRRYRSLHPVVGPARRLPEQLLVRCRRTGGRVLDHGAGRARAAAMAAPRLRRARSPSAARSACCASPAAGIFSPTSCSPACSCFWSSGRRTA